MKFFNKNINKVLSVVLVVVSVLVVLQFVCSNGTLNAGETPTESAMARVNPNIRKIVPTTTVSATTVPVETTTAKPKATKATTRIRFGRFYRSGAHCSVGKRCNVL